MRAGRANPSLVENIKAETYGQKMPINQIANINIIDATLITIKPWDKSNIDAIRKAISDSDLGLNPVVDGEIVRLPIPSLTEERRKEFVKIMKNKIEETKISIRQIRKEVLDFIDEQKSKKMIGEDDAERMEKDLQKMVEDANTKVEKLGEQKEKELMVV